MISEKKSKAVSTSDKMNPSFASTSASSTVILDLNDDCLLEVFKHLDLADICTTADVSRRFRHTSQKHFASPKFKNNILYILMHDQEKLLLETRDRRHSSPLDRACVICLNDDFLHRRSLRISKFLRNFEMLINSINISTWKKEIHYKSIKNILDLISLYCSDSLNELHFDGCNLTDEVVICMRHIKNLILWNCEYGKLFGQILSLWSPEL